MDHGALGQWLLQEAGNTVSLPLDGIILNDSLSGDALAKITQMPQLAAEAVFAFIDHDTPNSTVEVGGRQRQLIDFAVRRGLRLEVCQGAGYLRLLESYCRDGQIFVGTGRHMACLGTAGVLGLAVSEEALLTALAAGKLNVTIPEAVTVQVTGQLPRDAAWQDAGMALFAVLRRHPGKMVFLTGLEEVPAEGRFALFHAAGQSGIWSALPAGGSRDGETFDLSQVQLQVLLPEQDLGTALRQVREIPVQEVFIGGCRGGRIEDLRQAAAVLRGKHIAYRLRMVVAPISSATYVQALQEGLIDIFLDSGAVVMNQGCSVCWGRAQGILDKGEVLVSTGAYNYSGCCGNREARVYLVSPATAANAAVTGLLGAEG